jgi:hypothetical protein
MGFVNGLSSPANESAFELFLYLVRAILECIPADMVESLFEVICEHLEVALNSESAELAISAAHLCSAFLVFVSTLPEIMGRLFQSMLSAFVKAIRSEAAKSFDFCKDICKILKHADNFEDPRSIAQELFHCALDDTIPAAYRVLISGPIRCLVLRYFTEMKELLQELIAICLHLASTSFSGECFNDCDGVMFALRPLEILARESDSDVFFSTFWGVASTSAVWDILAMGASISLFVDVIPETIARECSQLFLFSFNCLGHSDHTVQECGIAILFELIARNSAQFVEHMERILQLLVAVCQTAHEPAIRSSLAFLAELLFVIEIPDQFIEVVLTLVSECLHHFPSHQDLAFTVFAALCQSSGESIRPFVTTILVLIRQALALSDFSLPKARAIEALGSLMANAPVETTEFTEIGPALFLECAACDDISAYSSAVLALTALARSSAFPISPENLFAVVTKSLELAVDPTTAVYECTAEAITQALALLVAVLKFHPDIVAPLAPTFAPLVSAQIDCEHIDVQTAAMKAGVDLARLLGVPAPDLLEKFTEHLEDASAATAALGFRGFARYLKRGLAIEDTLLEAVITAAFQGLKLELSCQSRDETLTLELSDEIFGFLAAVAQFCPAACPVDRLLKVCGKKGDLIVEIVGVFAEYWSVMSIASLAKTVLVDLFVQSLTFVNFDTPPHPISAIRCVVETDGLGEGQFETVLNSLAELLNREFEGQSCYFLVIGSVVSALLSILRVTGAQSASVQALLPKMFAAIPRCLSKAEAGNILTTIMSFHENSETFFTAYRSEISRIYASVLAMRMRKLRQLGIGDDLLQSLVRLFLTAASGDAGLLPRIAADFAPAAAARLMGRLHS